MGMNDTNDAIIKILTTAFSLKSHVQLLVFSVTPFKIDQNKNQNHSIDKVKILRKERR